MGVGEGQKESLQTIRQEYNHLSCHFKSYQSLMLRKKTLFFLLFLPDMRHLSAIAL